MTDFKIKRHLEINEKYQGANITEFYYSNSDYISNNDIINDFIHSNHIENDCIRDIAKNSPHRDEFLKGAFVLAEIFASDFKKSSKDGIKKFLNDMLLEPDWHEDIEDFKKIHDRFIDFLNDSNSDNYYLLSKSWFEDTDSKKIASESWVYIYYFLIFWIDNNSKILGFSEFNYD